MPGDQEGRGGTQVRFSDKMDWWCSRPLARGDLSTIPFVGKVAGETPTPAMCMREVRRRDIGAQMYGHGTPTFNGSLTDRAGLVIDATDYTQVATSHGNLKLSSSSPNLGFMPTVDAILFLKSEYVGSRLDPPPERFYR